MKSNNTLILAISLVACVAIVASVVLVAVAPDGTDPTLLLGGILGPAASLIATLVTLGRLEQTKSTVDDLANGKMDAKIRAGVADVLADHFIDPGAVEQIARDRTRREQSV